MARQLRVDFEGAVYHITSRGNQRGKIFTADWRIGVKLRIGVKAKLYTLQQLTK